MSLSISNLIGAIDSEFPGMSNLERGTLLAKVIRDIDAAMVKDAATIVPATIERKPRAKRVVKLDPVKGKSRTGKTTPADWRTVPAKVSDHAVLRMVACEIAMIGAYADPIVIGGYLLEWPSTIAEIGAMTHGDVSDRYAELVHYAKSVRTSFGANSANYAAAKRTLRVK